MQVFILISSFLIYLEKYISFSFSLYLVKFLVAGIFFSLSHVYLQLLFLYPIVKLIKKKKKEEEEEEENIPQTQ